MTEIYAPSRSLKSRLERQLAKRRHRHVVTPKLDRPIVSFSFDDCPKSVVETALPLLEREGWRATIYMSMGRCDTVNHFGHHMNQDDVKAAAKSGHEIGDHTFSHLDGQAVTLDIYRADIARNQAALADLGLPRSQTFAYPYGTNSPAVKQLVGSQFKLCRGVVPSSATNFDINFSPATPLYRGQKMKTAYRRLKALKDAPQWEVLFTHDVRDNASHFGCTPSDLAATIKTVKESGAHVLPVAEALAHVGGMS